MRAVVLFAGFLTFCVMSNIGAQVIYKWVDNDEVTHFSAQPPSGVDAERTTIKIQQSNRQLTQSRAEASAEKNAAAASRRQQDREQAAEEQDVAERNLEIRAENCKKARETYTTYSTSRRLYRQLENGEREYLDDNELENARTEAEQLVNKWCD